MALAFYNGEFIDPNQKTISIEDRGHQFGDGIYEVIRIYEGVPFKLKEHLDRLFRSAEKIQLTVPYSADKIHKIILNGIGKAAIPEAEVYLQITRGESPRQHAFPDTTPNVSMVIRPAQPVPESMRSTGVSVILKEDERWANCYIKSLNLLPNVLAKQAAMTAGSFEAILVREGIVTEGSSSNVFAVKNKELYTHPANKRILAGITRAVVIESARQANYTIHEQAFTPQFLVEADEVFITGTGYEILSVCSIDQKVIGQGKPGAITQFLQESYSGQYHAWSRAFKSSKT